MAFYHKVLGLLGLGILAAEDNLKAPTQKWRPEPKKLKRRIIPKGASYYHFDKDGNFTIADFPLADTVFSTISINDRMANFKFSRWDDHQIEANNEKPKAEND